MSQEDFWDASETSFVNPLKHQKMCSFIGTTFNYKNAPINKQKRREYYAVSAALPSNVHCFQILRQFSQYNPEK